MSVSKRLRFEVFRRDGFACRYCGATASDTTLTIDHVVPIALGGTDEPGNLVTACAPCNAGKTSSHPDAPLVADVAQDAMRWAQAQKVAAARMLEEHDARAMLHTEFEKRWSEWASEGKAVRLPAGWRQSVDSFMSAGLPMPILLECIDTAMRRKNVKNHDMFRYTCGIAWRHVTELRKATAAMVSPHGTQRHEADHIDEGCPHKAAISMLMGQLHGIELLADQKFVTFMASGFDLYCEDDGNGGDYSSWDDELKAVVQMFHVESGHAGIETVAQNLVESVLRDDFPFWFAHAEDYLRSLGYARWSIHLAASEALRLAVEHAVSSRGADAWSDVVSHEPFEPQRDEDAAGYEDAALWLWKHVLPGTEEEWISRTRAEQADLAEFSDGQLRTHALMTAVDHQRIALENYTDAIRWLFDNGVLGGTQDYWTARVQALREQPLTDWQLGPYALMHAVTALARAAETAIAGAPA